MRQFNTFSKKTMAEIPVPSLPGKILDMSEIADIANLYHLSYPREDSLFADTSPPHSPIDYERVALQDFDDIPSGQEFDAYNTASIFHREVTPSYLEWFDEHTSAHLAETADTISNMVFPKSLEWAYLADHPGAPWFRWRRESGHPEYKVNHNNQTIQCPYL
jgi:hypothetical protein